MSLQKCRVKIPPFNYGVLYFPCSMFYERLTDHLYRMITAYLVLHVEARLCL
jgi:hypothetical protein